MYLILELSGTGGRRMAVVIERAESFATELAGRADGHLWKPLTTVRDTAGITTALRTALDHSGAELVAVLANPGIVLDPEIGERMARVAGALPDIGRLGVAVASGVDRWGNVYSGLYPSLAPQLPFCRTPLPVVDGTSDLFIISRHLLERLLSGGDLPPLASLAGGAIIEGYLGGLVSLYAPGLTAGINGHLLDRDGDRHADVLSARFADRMVESILPTPQGPLPLGGLPQKPREWQPEAIADFDKLLDTAILPFCEAVRLSIVTRTQFSRPHLLRRLLTSLSRWRVDGVEVEVVLSTDIAAEKAEAEVEELRADFPALTLQLAANAERGEASRVRNLLGGIEAATGDYVAVIDDDDQIHFQALQIISTIRFMGALPLVLMDTELRGETWVRAGSGRWTLERTRPHDAYPARGWREMFDGVNKLPVCAALLPREWAVSHLRRFQFRHDYSEDYTLYLLLFGAQDLPLLLEVPRTLCIVSIRDDASNTVTEEDRSRWVRDISLFLHDLNIAQPQAGEGRTQLARRDGPSLPRAKAEASAPASASPDLRREVAVLRAENEALRERLAEHEYASTARGRG